MGVREEIESYLSGVTCVEQLKRQVIADSVGCSIHQVSRQASDLVKHKKESLLGGVKANQKKSTSKAESQQSKIELQILNELKKINSKIDSLEKRIKKMESEEWIANDGTRPPEDSKVKVKYCDGTIKVCYPNDVSWQTYDELLGYNYDRADRDFDNYADDEAHKHYIDFMEANYPSLVEFDVERSFRYNGIPEESEICDLFLKAYRAWNLKKKALIDEITKKEYDNFMDRNREKVYESEHIESYKIIDEANSTVMKKLNEILSKM